MVGVDHFCSQCGISLIPLIGSHISSECEICYRTRYFVRTGEGGKGIKVENGENLTVSLPPMSLKPGPGKFFKPGLSWFLRMVFYPPEVRPQSTDLERIFKTLEDDFDSIHRQSHVSVTYHYFGRFCWTGSAMSFSQ